MTLLGAVVATVFSAALTFAAFTAALVTDERRWCMLAIFGGFVSQILYWELRTRWFDSQHIGEASNGPLGVVSHMDAL